MYHNVIHEGQRLGLGRSIKSFKGKWSRPLFDDVLPRGFPPDVFTVARRKLMMLDRSQRLEDLRCLRLIVSKP
jgi:plasmid maintenance system killer protein